jgi:hypothetical protein
MKLTKTQKGLIKEMRAHSVRGFLMSFKEKDAMIKKNIEQAKRARRDSRLVNLF